MPNRDAGPKASAPSLRSFARDDVRRLKSGNGDGDGDGNGNGNGDGDGNGNGNGYGYGYGYGYGDGKQDPEQRWA